MSIESNMIKSNSEEELSMVPVNDVQNTSEGSTEMPSTSSTVTVKLGLAERVEKEFYGTSIIGLANKIEQELYGFIEESEVEKKKRLETIAALLDPQTSEGNNHMDDSEEIDYDSADEYDSDSDEDECECEQMQELCKEVHGLGINPDHLRHQTNHVLIGFKINGGITLFVEVDHVGDLPKTTVVWIEEGINYKDKRLSIVPGSTVPSLKVLAAVNAPLKY